VMGDRIDFSSGLSDQSGHLVLVVAGTHAVSSRTGSATLFSRPITFTPAGLQPGDLLPALGDALQAADGTVELRGALGWHDGTQTCDLRLLLQDLSFRTRQAAIGRINGVIAFDRLSPLTTPPHQKIAVAQAELGLPLTDGLVDFQLRPGPLLEVAGGTFHLAGGTTSLDPVTLGVGGVQELRLAATDIDLDQLLALSSIAGLRAKGRLTGAIPLVIGPGFVEVRGGRLDTTGPGWIGYPKDQQPPALPAADEAGRLDLAALANLHYEQLRLTFDRDAAGRVSISLGIKRKDPSLPDGPAVELAVDLTGRIERHPPPGPTSYRLPDSIREQQSSFRN
jgi:translocation and assembly module TamB